MIKNRYPLPLIQDIFDQLGGRRCYILDMHSGYLQIPVDEASIERTTFVCYRGLFEWTRLPFGIDNAPSFYQRTLNKVLEKFIGFFMLVFINDIVIYSKTEKEHEEHVRLVLETLEMLV